MSSGGTPTCPPECEPYKAALDAQCEIVEAAELAKQAALNQKLIACQVYENACDFLDDAIRIKENAQQALDDCIAQHGQPPARPS